MHWFRMILALLLFTPLVSADSTETRTAAVDQPAPDFALMDYRGTRHSLSDFRGKYVILEWVNFDCPFVQKHYSSGNMQKLQKMYADKGVVWLSICSSAPGKQGHFEGADLVNRIKKEKSVPTAYLLDEEGTVGKTYEAKTTPHMYVINPKGVLIYAGGIDNIPSTNVDDIDRATNYVKLVLDGSMAGKEVTVKSSKPYGCSVKYK